MNRQSLISHLHDLLCAAAVNRGPNFVQDEMAVMHTEVNRLRAELGKPPVPISRVEEIEQSASGHCDYGHKYALRCAFLVEE